MTIKLTTANRNYLL